MIKIGKIKKKNFNERVSETAYKTVVEALQSILATEIKKTGLDDKEAVDFAMTVSTMRMKARIALDFVNNLKNGVDKK